MSVAAVCRERRCAEASAHLSATAYHSGRLIEADTRWRVGEIFSYDWGTCLPFDTGVGRGFSGARDAPPRGRLFFFLPPFYRRPLPPDPTPPLLSPKPPPPGPRPATLLQQLGDK